MNRMQLKLMFGILMAASLTRGATFVFPANLDFCGENDGTTLRQALAVASSQSGGTFTAQATQSWISVPATGVLNSVFPIGVNTSGLPTGTQTGSINVTASDGSTATATVTVQLFPAGASVPCPTNSPEPFWYKIGSDAPSPEILQIGGSGPFTVQFNTGSWLDVATNGSAPGVVVLGVNRAVAKNLASGQYTEMVSLASSGGTATLPAVLNVTDSTVVQVMPGTLVLDVSPSQPPASHTIELQSDPAVQINLNVDASRDCLSGAGPLSGTTPLQVHLAPLSIGTPQICDSGLFGTSQAAANSPFFAPVRVNVTNNPINFGPSFIQNGAPQGLNAPNESISVTGSTTALQLNTITSDTDNWLSVTGSGPTYELVFNNNQLPVGDHYGAVIASENNTPVAEIPVTFTTAPPLPKLTLTPPSFTVNVLPGATAAETLNVASDPSGLTFTVKVFSPSSDEQVSVSPSTITTPGNVTLTVVAGSKLETDFVSLNFSMPGSVYGRGGTINVTNLKGPQSLEFQYTQGGPLPGAQTFMVTSADDAQAPFTLKTGSGTSSAGNFLIATPASGTLPGTITVALDPAVIATLTAPNTYTGFVNINTTSEGSLQVPVTLTISAGVMPTISAVTDAADFKPGKVVPGGSYTLFGTHLTSATGINQASAFPIPVNLVNSGVKINGELVPVLAVDKVGDQEQINFIASQSLTGPTAEVAAVNGGVTGPAITVEVVDNQPSLYTFVEGNVTDAVALHANFKPVTPADPALPKETILLYGNACGKVVSPPADGEPASGQKTVLTPVITIGGENAIVQFSGFAPGFANLCQFNVTLAADQKPGNQPVTVTFGGVPSNTAMLPVGK